MKTSPIPIAKWLTVVLAFIALLSLLRDGRDFWSTPDQRGQRMFNAGDFEAASKNFADPFRRGVSLARAKDFKAAASVFAGLPGAEAAMNHGNALVMQGQYDAAVKRYDRALELRPGWQDAIENRELAAIRAERLKDEPGIGTEGKLEADEIVFDLDNDQNPQAGEEETAGGQASDAELRQAWLRQVQTTPREFLKSKFAYQDAIRECQSDAKEAEQ